MNKKCVGCGSLLQNIDELDAGFVKDLNHDYCLRCFKNIHYSEIKNQELKYSNNDLINYINSPTSSVFN